MEKILITALLLPIVGFLFSGIAGKFLSKTALGTISSLTILGSFICSVAIFNFLSSSNNEVTVNLFNWIKSDDININFSFVADNLSIWMMMIITGVGFLIHIYSIGYMHSDSGFAKFFSYLNLFVFMMLVLVAGANYVVLFIGWEGVGLCSYLLIGFWYKNNEYGYAARKAFVMNRIGDLGFLIGIFMLINQYGTADFNYIFSNKTQISESTIEIICILLLVGAVGKSAQIPLFTWLPDAMAGPTPVSALIHAATMVTAGIYLIARSSSLFVIAEFASAIVVIVGLATAFIAAMIALKQNDIKKVLAYSTVSQLGYMFVALGVGAYSTAIFHVTTHAFFKALLFLGSGSVIHAMGGQQDIRLMGGLLKKIKITNITFLLGTLAITGVPLLSGFFSKDEILAKSYYGSGILVFSILTLTSVITAIYMFRLYFMTFTGSFRGTENEKNHLHESPANMTIPLIILAVLACIGGLLGLSSLFSHHHYIDNWLKEVVSNKEIMHPTHLFEIIVLVVSIIVLAAVILVCNKNYNKNYYTKNNGKSENILSSLLKNKFYFDEIYDLLIVKPIIKLSELLYSFIDTNIIDKIVNFTGTIVSFSGNQMRKVLNGKLEYYLLLMVLSVVSFLILIQIL
ncbi:MAG: NADH-quinone oxidoreductase subunit L [Bacteroidetes bacterium]|nr:NADH-quinone oxidoreductase subunit L [Bacteroidota bacterium]